MSPSPVIVFTVTSYSVPEMGLMLSITPAASPEVVVREKSSVATLITASSKVTVKMTLALVVGLASPALRTIDTKLGAIKSTVTELSTLVESSKSNPEGVWTLPRDIDGMTVPSVETAVALKVKFMSSPELIIVHVSTVAEPF